jgi:phosphate starvation-inducible protein PhoH and related proteins
LSEVIIPIDTFNPVEFFGVNDSNLEVIRKKFPELKLVARGNEIKVLGDEKNILQFSEKINRLIQHYQKFGSLTVDNVEHFLSQNGKDTAAQQQMNTADVLVFGQNGVMVRARTANQKKMVESSEKNDVVFAIGPAGTGKTYTAVALAVRALKNREIKRIILTRPAVEAGENLGFLPGDLKEKIDPYLRPLYDALYDMIQGEKVKSYIESGVIEVAPLAFMRGRTLDNAFVILDEAQNATESQLKMFLTRMGPSAKFIVTGDITQIDLPKNQPSGLVQAIKVLPSIKGIDFIYLDGGDVVRHRLVKEIIEAYHK